MLILIGDPLEVCAGALGGVVTCVFVEKVGEGTTRGAATGNALTEGEAVVVLAAGITGLFVAGFTFVARCAGWTCGTTCF
jgi:hypothetical protein